MPYAAAGELGHSRAQTPSLPTHRVSPGYERIIAEAPESVNRYSKKPQIGGNLCYIRWQKISNRSMFPQRHRRRPGGRSARLIGVLLPCNPRCYNKNHKLLWRWRKNIDIANSQPAVPSLPARRPPPPAAFLWGFVLSGGLQDRACGV
jgi:hypothetical protein